MKRYETQQRAIEVLAATSCDGCGLEPGWTGDLVSVVISVNAGEEGGSVDEYDYCDDCLVARAPLLVAAGSCADLVSSEPDESAGPT